MMVSYCGMGGRDKKEVGGETGEPDKGGEVMKHLTPKGRIR